MMLISLPVINVSALVYNESTICIGPLNTVADPGPSMMTLNEIKNINSLI